MEILNFEILAGGSRICSCVHQGPAWCLVREALEAAAERHHHPGASDGGDGGGSAGERTGQRRGPRGDLRALPRLNGL
jgi:hypothetical protein